jgi:hypothetical protein
LERHRYHYNPQSQQLRFTLARTPHKVFVANITRLIQTKINVLAASGGRVGELMATVESRGTTAFRTVDVDLTSAVHMHRPHELQPDASWGGKSDAYPGLTVEVAFSQRRSSLVKKINKVLGFSGGHVRCVIGIELGCSGPSTTVQVWRSRIERPLLIVEVVRQPDVSIQRLRCAFWLYIRRCHFFSGDTGMLVSTTPVG